jgi:hypothetical protein
VAVVAGSGAGAKEALRWRLRKQMEAKTFAELLEISRQMED